MPDFPSELVEAIRDGKWTIEQEIATTIAHADGQTPIPDLAALIAARVVPLIQQAERDRLAKQAGTNPYIDGDGIPTWAAWEAWDEGAACGVAAERERVREAITRLADTYAPNGTFLPTASILSLLSSPAEPTPHADNANAAIPDLAALIAARVVPLIQQAERDRLAKQAGEIKQFPASDCQIHENERCVEMPCCGFTFAADHLDHSDEDTYTCPVCSPMFACGAAAERERIESLPRYVAVTQEAWRPGDRPPIMHECVALADVRELPVRPSHPDAEAASTTPGGLNTDRSESAALSSPAEPDTEEGGDAQ